MTRDTLPPGLQYRGEMSYIAVLRAHRLAVRTPPSHGGNRGSIPLGRTNNFKHLADLRGSPVKRLGNIRAWTVRPYLTLDAMTIICISRTT